MTNKQNTALGISLFVMVAAFCMSLLVGSAGWPTEWNPTMQTIFMHIRLPRALGAVLAGSALAISGALVQTVLNNPLASSNLIGINSAAGFFSILMSILLPTSFVASQIAGFIGGLICAGLILLLVWVRHANKLTVLLAGLAISQLFNAGIDLLTVFVPDALNGYVSFKIGSLASVSLTKCAYGASLIIPALLLVFACTRQFEMFSLGTRQSQALGLSVRKWTIIFLMIASLLSAATVSFAGMLGFVGLIVPAWLRRFHLPPFAYLGQCVCCGAALVCIADLIGRVLVLPWEMPAGLILSLAGGPYFLYLLLGRRGLNA